MVDDGIYPDMPRARVKEVLNGFTHPRCVAGINTVTAATASRLLHICLALTVHSTDRDPCIKQRRYGQDNI
jgi:hypothetical protein